MTELTKELQEEGEVHESFSLDLIEKEDLPVRFKYLVRNIPTPENVSLEDHVKLIEKEALLRKLFLYSFVGMTLTERMGREAVVEFRASNKHHYFEPYCIRFKKEREGNYIVLSDFLPCSLNVKEMLDANPLKGNEEFVKFLRHIQLCVEAYHDRKHQIDNAKVILSSRNISMCFSIDYMFVVLAIERTNINNETVMVDIQIQYECNQTLPSCIEPKCRDIDKNELSRITNEFKILKSQRLDDALFILCVKSNDSLPKEDNGNSTSVPNGGKQIEPEYSSLESMSTISVELQKRPKRRKFK